MLAFDPDLPAKPRIVALNKADLLPPDFPRERVIKAYRQAGWRVFPLSALTGQGMAEFQQALLEEMTRLPEELQ